LKIYQNLVAIIFGSFLCLVMACSSTMLRGTVLTSENQPATNLEIEVSAELDSEVIKTTKVNKTNGIFILKGLEPNSSYKIIAECKKDETKAVAENVYINKGKNQLRSNKLILPTHITPSAEKDTSSRIPPEQGTIVPDSP